MTVKSLSNNTDPIRLLQNLGVDSGGVNILASKSKIYFIEINGLKVGGANILKQDALSIGADLAVPRGTVVAATPKVNCLLIATAKQLKLLSHKELAQPFGLKEVAYKLQNILKVQTPTSFDIMGIINANDDSFFNDSRFLGNDAISKIESMIEEGASIIDIGGVSSRPNAPIVSEKEELLRVSPILDLIAKNRLYEHTKFSIDSYTPSVISKALESGFNIVNDITGFGNDAVCKLTAEYNATAIIMHMQGTPQTMQNSPKYSSLLDEIYSFFEERIEKASSFGVKDIVLDLGIGFGKSLEDNLSLIKNIESFLTLDKQILIGASRKSMIDKISSSKVQERLSGTIALHLEAYKNGASILRVHDVKEHLQALRVYEALKKV